ncbi:hypothetical protein OEV98_15850 [Caldibacillus lycopersici]|uniref:Uncharacterized protein n=1 Tax=Perspicuibacillus lycopersici TaxID=1325689 RepID=A0AAE3LRT0_9BACI|nr:hypothetical protein [Perspicuibacillus lycopersici]MCU9615009.1 hypothetical protein [Perspicuibacillus lycopersici]
MLNHFEVFQLMKLRQEQTEQTASIAWENYPDTNKMKVTTAGKQQYAPIICCCQCA